MKHIISLLLFACPALVSTAPDNDKAVVQAVIAKHYNRPLAAHKCWLTKPSKDGQVPSNSIMYCTKPVADHTVAHNNKVARCVLYTGFAYDMEQEIKQDAHASPGLVELFVLKKTDDRWTIKQHGEDEASVRGDVPGNKAWEFIQVGAQNQGYTAESSYTGQGDTTTSQSSLFTDNSNHIRKSFIISGNDNGAYFGGCDGSKGHERRDCKDGYTSMEARITFDRSRPIVSGVWALTAKLSGVSGKKNYKDQKYIFPYNGKTRVAPKNYPLDGQ